MASVNGDVADAVLGLRPEDCRLSPDGPLQGRLYAVELIGDHTLITINLGEQLLTVKGPRDYSGNGVVRVAFDPPHSYVFDAESGRRIRDGVAESHPAAEERS
jgi:multiple sugar transport system ATP-binding protein